MEEPLDHVLGEESLHERRHPMHGVLRYPCIPTIVFVTMCTKDRCKWLADPDVHRLLRDVWTDAAGWAVGRYVIMPDHIHLFAAPGDTEVSLENWMSYWKRDFAKRHGVPEHRWQTDHWDRRLRRSENYSEKWLYVRYNPVRKGLVADPDDWPYQGEIHILSW